MKRICLIGGTGFIGSNIYKALIENKKIKYSDFLVEKTDL